MGNPKIEDYEWKMRTVMSNDIELDDSDEVVLTVNSPINKNLLMRSAHEIIGLTEQ